MRSRITGLQSQFDKGHTCISRPAAAVVHSGQYLSKVVRKGAEVEQQPSAEVQVGADGWPGWSEEVRAVSVSCHHN